GTFKGRELVVTDVPFTRGPEKASDGDRGTENTADGRTVGRKNRPSEKPTVGKSDTTKTVNHEDPIDEEPPLPPQEPVAVAQGGEDLQALEDQDLTPYQRWQRDKPPSPLPASRLASSHPAVWSALAGFRRAIGKVTDGQFAAWTAKVVEHVEKYGERTVIDALETTTLKAGLKDPFAYYRKVVGRAPSGEPEYREVSAAEFLEGSWN